MAEDNEVTNEKETPEAGENPNFNCLDGMQCPQCGSYEPFSITVTTCITIYDNGSDEHGDIDWGADSDCRCIACDFEGKVREFREEDEPAAGPCVTCGTPCVADGSLAVICPNCDWKERAIALLKALGDLGGQDLYTDAHEYGGRVGAMQRLCHGADLMAAGVEVSMADIEEYAAETDGEEK